MRLRSKDSWIPLPSRFPSFVAPWSKYSLDSWHAFSTYATSCNFSFTASRQNLTTFNRAPPGSALYEPSSWQRYHHLGSLLLCRCPFFWTLKAYLCFWSFILFTYFICQWMQVSHNTFFFFLLVKPHFSYSTFFVTWIHFSCTFAQAAGFQTNKC